MTIAVTALNMAIAIYMVVLVYNLLLGGFIVAKNALPDKLQWAVQTSYFFYGFESLCVNEFENKPYGEDVLQSMGFEKKNKFLDLYVLIGVFITLRIVAYLLMRFLHKEKR
jgi:hypothetical protein